MQPKNNRALKIVIASLLFGALLPSANASFHSMQIYEVVGGINGDTSAQAIELRMRFNGQNLLGGQGKLVAVDAAGLNPVTLISFGSNVALGNAGSTVLITTANFKNYTSNPTTFTSDFTFTNSIPVSYLSAGRLLYEDASSNILWSLAFGGASYIGLTNGETQNGPPDPGKFGGPLPKNSLQALVYQGAASGTNSNNAIDYALTAGAATFTNNAGINFTVVPEASSTVLLGFGLIVVLLATRRRSRVRG